MNTTDSLAPIRTASKARLRDTEWLARTITDLGLARPRWDETARLDATDSELGVWQSPIQLAPYLVHLSHLGIRSYVELGVFEGGTFAITVEYLSRFAKLDRAVAVDMHIRPQVREYAATNPVVEVIEAPTSAPQVAAALADRVDLVLVDADHSADWCRHDWRLARRYARYVAFHDIVEFACPDVEMVWREIVGPKWEWTGQYENSRRIYGIGLVQTEDSCQSVTRSPAPKRSRGTPPANRSTAV